MRFGAPCTSHMAYIIAFLVGSISFRLRVEFGFKMTPLCQKKNHFRQLLNLWFKIAPPYATYDRCLVFYFLFLKFNLEVAV